MDDLTRYIFGNFGSLMTFHEKAAYKSMLGQLKLEHCKPEGMRRMLQEEWISSDPKVLELLSNGSEQFMIGVRERMLREKPDQVYLNYCPRCGALARTPEARQCPKCFYSWHGST